MKKHSSVISIRVPNDIVQLIDKERQILGVSRGDLVRHITYSHYQSQDNEPVIALVSNLVERMDQFEAEFGKLNSNFARALFAMLTVVGGMDPANAKQIIRTKLLT